MAVYDSCCWCLPLRTGCVLIALLEIIFQILANLAVGELQVTIAAVISANLVAITFTGLLLYGTIMRKRSWLWLWVAIDLLIVILLGVLVVMVATGYSSDAEQTDHGYSLLTAVVIGVISTALAAAQIVFALVVFSYISKLREEQRLEATDLVDDETQTSSS